MPANYLKYITWFQKLDINICMANQQKNIHTNFINLNKI